MSEADWKCPWDQYYLVWDSCLIQAWMDVIGATRYSCPICVRKFHWRMFGVIRMYVRMLLKWSIEKYNYVVFQVLSISDVSSIS